MHAADHTHLNKTDFLTNKLDNNPINLNQITPQEQS